MDNPELPPEIKKRPDDFMSFMHKYLGDEGHKMLLEGLEQNRFDEDDESSAMLVVASEIALQTGKDPRIVVDFARMCRIIEPIVMVYAEDTDEGDDQPRYDISGYQRIDSESLEDDS